MTTRPDTGPCKIGFTTDIAERRKAMQTYHYQRVEVSHKFECRNASRAKRLEALVHLHLAGSRMRGEWFALNADECAEAISATTNKYRGLTLEEMDEIISRQVTVDIPNI